MLWNDLKDIASTMNGAWMLAGNFNDIICVEEKRGGASRHELDAVTFCELVAH
jgi:hypothetical protein